MKTIHQARVLLRQASAFYFVRKKQASATLIGLLVVSVAAILFKTSKQKTAEETLLPQVYTETIEPKDRFDPLWFYAKIGPETEMPIVSEVAGRIEKWFVKSSETVKKGTPIVTVRPMDSALNSNAYTVRAEVAGEMGAILFEKGELIKTGEQLTQIWDPTKRILQWQVSYDDLDHLRPGQEVEAFYEDPMFFKSLKSFETRNPQDGNVEKGLPIKILSASHIEQQRGLGYQVRAEMTCRVESEYDPCSMIPAKSWVRVLIRTNQRKAIELSSSLAHEKDPFVFVVNKDSVVEKREIKIGNEFAGSIEVLSGLSAGDVVVTSYGTKPEPGKPVSVVKREGMTIEGDSKKAEAELKKDKG